ncbi:MAG: hypothetical protein QF412_14970, partial [Planctomycetota bacterium]|nr:hypothetical protein [Planctomycetota bacterium]
PTGIFDITNKRAPRRIATWHTGGSRAIVHNAYVRDRVVHISYYTEGYQALDLSNPSSPQNVGFYDTWPGSSSGYNGAWGCYPFQPSGHIYLNDISTGLYVFKPKCAVRFYGSVTKGTTAPEIHAFGAAYSGNGNFAFQVENAGPGKRGILVISAAKANANVKGLRINVSLNGAIAIPFQTNSSGEATIKAPVPSRVTKGLLYAQGFVMDASGPLGIAATQGMEVEAFVK